MPGPSARMYDGVQSEPRLPHVKESPVKRLNLQLFLFFLLTTSSIVAQDFSGVWQGTLQPGPDQRRVVVEISPKDGLWHATACHLEFAHDPLKIDSLAANGTALTLTLEGGKTTFHGQITADGTSIDGLWSLDNTHLPLTLHRATQQSAWHVPFQYQYHNKNVTYLRPSSDEPKIPFTPSLALEYIEQGASAWTDDWHCVACHTNGSYMVVRPMLTSQIGPPQQQMRAYFLASLREELAADPADLRPELDSTQAVYIAAGLAIWDANVTHSLSAETAQALDFMFRLQRADGDWTISDDNNPPLESSRFQLATVAARAIANAPGWLAQKHGKPIDSKITILENYLRAEGKMQGDYDRTDLLWAASELPGLLTAQRKQQLIETVARHQMPDGGWSIRTFAQPEEWGKGNRAQKLRAEPELLYPPSDGHMTGLAIIALRKSGIPATDPGIQRGVAWMLANQSSSGSWYTRSLNRDGWQFITYSGTLYPILALSLCNALPTQHHTVGHQGVRNQGAS